MFEKLRNSIVNKRRHKFSKVMEEFSRGKLKSHPTGKVVTNVKQAQAIAYSEAGMSRRAK